MKPRFLSIGFLLLSAVGLIAGWCLRNSTELGLCLLSEPTCINNLTRLGDGLFYGMGALAIVFLALLFIQKAFSAWWKFGIWFIPLAALLFIFYPEPGGMDLAMPYPETFFQWVGGLYLGVSAVIIATAAAKKG